MSHQIPDEYELARTTATFTNDTVPAGLLSAHRVADGIWGRLVVHSGTVGFVFEDDPHTHITITAGDSIAIPPGRLHHIQFDQPATIAVEFYRKPAEPSPAPSRCRKHRHHPVKIRQRSHEGSRGIAKNPALEPGRSPPTPTGRFR